MTDLLNNTALWAALLGLLTPLVTAIAQQPGWSKPVRTVVGVLVSAAVAVVTLLSTGQITDLAVTAPTLLLVIAVAQVSYKTLWQRTGVTDLIEVGTSLPFVQPTTSPARPADQYDRPDEPF